MSGPAVLRSRAPRWCALLACAALAASGAGCQNLQRALRTPTTGADHLVFTSFRHMDPDGGLYLLYSRNGYAWKRLNGGEPVYAAGHPGLRDPHVSLGPDGLYHMVWTGGARDQIGYARSPDLLDWTDPRFIPVMAPVPGVQNCWAPEALYGGGRGRWLVHWSSTVDGMFEHTLHEGDRNHRIWAATTTDFQEFSEPFILFDPGFNVIDSSILPLGGRYYLFFKDERVNPWKKHIHYAVADDPMGPYTQARRTVDIQWIEGPSPIVIGPRVFVYYDFYARGRYGGMTSRDMIHWADRTDAMSFPEGHRHGTVIRVPPELAQRLLDEVPP